MNFCQENPRIISRGEDGYCGWPTLLRRGGGELLAVASGRRSGHVSPDGRVLLFTSQDEGRTWSSGQPLTHGPLDDRDAGIAELPDGALVVTWFTSMAWARALDEAALFPAERAEWAALLGQTRQGRWRELRSQLPDALCNTALGCWAIRSGDGGQSWSAPVAMPVGNPHGPVVLGNGKLVMAGSIKAHEPLRAGRNGSPFGVGIAAAESSDGGRSWRQLGLVPVAEGYEAAHYHEPHLVETAGGNLLMLLRNHAPHSHGELLQSISADGGQSWSPPRPIGHWGYPAHLLRLRDGRLLATYSHRREPRGIRVITSEDEGGSWSGPLVIHAGGGVDFGYPSTVELAGGEYLTLWYDRETSSPGTAPALLKLKRWSGV